MGLDMYLSKRINIYANFDFNKITGNVEIFANGKKIPLNLNRITYISEDVGYWRKANAIHGWFVDNVQEGVDNCGDYLVTLDNLKDLYKICKQISNDNSLAEELLPTRSGFFFGSYDYDDWYFENIEQTIQILKPLIEEMEYSQEGYSIDIYYSASW